MLHVIGDGYSYDAFMDGFRHAMLVTGAIALVGAVLAWVLVPPRLPEAVSAPASP